MGSIDSGTENVQSTAVEIKASFRARPSVSTPPATPCPLSTSTYNLLGEIRIIHYDLLRLKDLVPGEQINGLLTRLVALCITPYSTEFTSYFFSLDGVDAMCLSLRRLCATAEGELESYWARRILFALQNSSRSTAQIRDELEQFPYYDNYVELSRLEVSLLTAFLPTLHSSSRARKIAFIGSGPLPLSSFCLLETLPSSSIIHNIDRDAEAIQVSKSLAQKLGYAQSMTFACEDVSLQAQHTTTKWEEFEVIFLAALVGMSSSEKSDMLGLLASKLRPGTLVVARSARGLREVLYPVLELSDDLARIGYEVLAEVHPWTSVVNSIVVLRVKRH